MDKKVKIPSADLSIDDFFDLSDATNKFDKKEKDEEIKDLLNEDEKKSIKGRKKYARKTDEEKFEELKKKLSKDGIDENNPPYYGLDKKQFEGYKALAKAHFNVIGKIVCKKYEVEEISEDELDALAESAAPIVPEFLFNKYANLAITVGMLAIPRIIEHKKKELNKNNPIKENTEK